MRKFVLILSFYFLALFLIILTTKQIFAEEPKPFGLTLGKTTKDEALVNLRKEGGKQINSGYRIIKGEIHNPSIEGYYFKNLPLENLQNASFWFFEGVLFQINYEFPLSMSKEEFYVLYNQLSSKYGKPAKYVKPYLADGLALWKFKEIEMKLLAPWVSSKMYLIYTHIPLSKKADLSDQKVFKQETSKPQRGF